MVISYWAMQNKINEHLRHATNLDDETISEAKERRKKMRKKSTEKMAQSKESEEKLPFA